MITAGLDIGSLTTKAVVLKDGAIVGWHVLPTGDSSSLAAEVALKAALEQGGLSYDNLEAVVATGAGKKEVGLAKQQATDVMCMAKGIRFLHPGVKGVIDMGAESTRVAKLDETGRVVDFGLNDKCAAGTGVFLDAMGKVMGVKVDEMGPLSLESTADVNITSTCVVFAESEVVSQVHRQTPKNDILRGIHKSIAGRVYGMVSRVGLDGDNVAIGGLAKNTGIVTCLEEIMKVKLAVPENPQIVAALGAAVIGAEQGGAEYDNSRR
jgi:predicted CoA-substrate-specific enzyme activase